MAQYAEIKKQIIDGKNTNDEILDAAAALIADLHIAEVNTHSLRAEYGYNIDLELSQIESVYNGLKFHLKCRRLDIGEAQGRAAVILDAQGYSLI